MGFYPEQVRVAEVIPKNLKEVAKGLKPLEQLLQTRSFILGEKFQVTDINVGYTMNWASKKDFLSDFPTLQKYLDRLKQQKACPFND